MKIYILPEEFNTLHEGLKSDGRNHLDYIQHFLIHLASVAYLLFVHYLESRRYPLRLIH